MSVAQGIDQEWINSLLTGSRRPTQYELLDEVNRAFDDYDSHRKKAVEILSQPSMEEAIVDELENMGFIITEAS
jgi:hypothetical protein